jgi:hypothetical protein
LDHTACSFHSAGTKTGWINALAKTKLTVEPVGWREWLEELSDFR